MRVRVGVRVRVRVSVRVRVRVKVRVRVRSSVLCTTCSILQCAIKGTKSVDRARVRG